MNSRSPAGRLIWSCVTFGPSEAHRPQWHDSMTGARGSVRREAGVHVAVPRLQAVHQVDRLAQPQASQPLYCLLSAARRRSVSTR